MHHRALDTSEIDAALHIFVTGLQAYAQRHGLTPPNFTEENSRVFYKYLHEHGIFECAADAQGVRAIACAQVWPASWFLASFWMDPNVRQRGIGKPLLQRVVDKGRERGATTFSVWSSLDHTAVATYIKVGMLPVTPIFGMAGVVPTGRATSQDGALQFVPLTLPQAAAVDSVVLGYTRDADNAFFTAQEFVGTAALADGRLVGYHRCRGGFVGPVAWTDPQYGADIFSHALQSAAAAEQGKVRLSIFGDNTLALTLALQLGLQLTSTSHFLSSSRQLKTDRYIPSGPFLL